MAEQTSIDLSVEGGIRGFMFDVDGTLAHRDPTFRAHPQPGALEVLDKIRSSGRRFVAFTNASHVPSVVIAEGLRKDGFGIADDEVLTPVDSATAYLLKHYSGRPVKVFAPPAVTEWMTERGVQIVDGMDAEAVFVGHLQQVDLDDVVVAARAIEENGAKLLTGSYVRGYAALNSFTHSRGAMITAAISKASGVRPKVVGKPSAAAVAALSERLGVPPSTICCIGDDHRMDTVMGNLCGGRAILVRSGTSGQISLDGMTARQRPDVAVDGVAELLPWL